ncbi:MAG: hypothetical protein ACRD8Z_27090, partial [Nitrososphaeraceae archaeon]
MLVLNNRKLSLDWCALSSQMFNSAIVLGPSFLEPTLQVCNLFLVNVQARAGSGNIALQFDLF